MSLALVKGNPDFDLVKAGFEVLVYLDVGSVFWVVVVDGCVVVSGLGVSGLKYASVSAAMSSKSGL